MNDNQSSSSSLTLPKQVDVEIWIQCQLRLLIDLEIKFGWPLDGVGGENVNFFRTRIDALLDTPLTGALEEVMFEVCEEEDFKRSYDEVLEELDFLSPDHAGRLALNQTMARFWPYIRDEVDRRERCPKPPPPVMGQ